MIDIAVGVESVGTPGTVQVLGDVIDGTHYNAQGNKRAAAGAGFNVPAKIPGAAAINPGFKYPAGALYQSIGFPDWGAQQAAATVNNRYSPEHKVTATLLREDTSATTLHAIVKEQAIALASTTKKITVFAKRVTGSRNIRIEVQQSGANYANSAAIVNLQTGAQIFLDNGAGAVSGLTTTKDADDFWKIEFSVAFSASHPANSYLWIKMADAAGDQNYTGDGASSIAVWGYDIR